MLSLGIAKICNPTRFKLYKQPTTRYYSLHVNLRFQGTSQFMNSVNYKPGGDDGSRALLNNATIGTIELVEAFEEALP